MCKTVRGLCFWENNWRKVSSTVRYNVEKLREVIFLIINNSSHGVKTVAKWAVHISYWSHSYMFPLLFSSTHVAETSYLVRSSYINFLGVLCNNSSHHSLPIVGNVFMWVRTERSILCFSLSFADSVFHKYVVCCGIDSLESFPCSSAVLEELKAMVFSCVLFSLCDIISNRQYYIFTFNLSTYAKNLEYGEVSCGDCWCFLQIHFTLRPIIFFLLFYSVQFKKNMFIRYFI